MEYDKMQHEKAKQLHFAIIHVLRSLDQNDAVNSVKLHDNVVESDDFKIEVYVTNDPRYEIYVNGNTVLFEDAVFHAVEQTLDLQHKCDVAANLFNVKIDLNNLPAPYTKGEVEELKRQTEEEISDLTARRGYGDYSAEALTNMDKRLERLNQALRAQKDVLFNNVEGITNMELNPFD